MNEALRMIICNILNTYLWFCLVCLYRTVNEPKMIIDEEKLETYLTKYEEKIK